MQKPSLTGLFGLTREMGYSRSEFFSKLPTALAGYEYVVQGDLVNIQIGDGRVRLVVGEEGERRLSPHICFPILPVKVTCEGLREVDQAGFFKQFERTYFKGLA